MAGIPTNSEIRRNLTVGKELRTTVGSNFSVEAFNQFVTDARENLIVTVGIHEDAGSNNGVSIAEYAFYNEFGTTTIPERSFMRTTLDEKGTLIEETFQKLIARALAGKSNLYGALDTLGLFVSGLIQKKITDIREPPNCPATIKRKGSSNPLIDTGAMRQAVSWKVRKDEEG